MGRLLNLGRAIACAVIFVSVLEACARIDDALSYGAPLWGVYDDQALYLKDQLGRWGRPGGRYERWQLNSLGYRGPELQPQTLRIVCFGASETFGLYEDPGEEYPRQLERDLNSLAGGNRIQVINAAYPGETLRTATVRIPQVISQVSPSFALIYPSVADYILLAPAQPAPNAASEAPGEIATTPSDLVSQLRLAKRVRNLLKAALPQAVQTKLRELEIRRDAARFTVVDRVPEENVRRFQEELTALIVALHDRGVEPVLATHATVFAAQLTPRDRELLVAWRKFFPMLKEDGFIDMERRMNQVIRETATLENVLLIDVQSEIPHRPEYFADFSHFTNAGAQVMAAVLTAGMKPIVLAKLLGANSPLTTADHPQILGSKNSARTTLASER